MAAGAAEGVLFRSGDAIEQLAGVDTLVFDRAGTLTRPEWRLAGVSGSRALPKAGCEALFAQVVTRCCRPPVAHAYEGEVPRIGSLSHAELKKINGEGLHMRRDGQLLSVVGVETAVARFGVALSARQRHAAPGDVVICLLLDGRCVGVARFNNALAPGAASALVALRHAGIEQIHMITQESRERLHPDLCQLELDELQSQLVDLDKRRFVRDLIEAGRRVAVISDGLFRADGECLNICVGAEPEARPLEADVWLLRGDVRQLVPALALARRCRGLQKSQQRSNFGANGAVLLAASFDLLPPTAAAVLSNSVTLAMMHFARGFHTGSTQS
jgi:cation transport ATPase